MAESRPSGYETAKRHFDKVMRQLGIPSTNDNLAYIALALMALVEGIDEDMKRVHERLDAIERQLKDRRT